MINEGDSFSRSGFFVDPDLNTWTATVDYGDGSGIQPLGLNAAKTFDLSHRYADNGLFLVTVKVSDGVSFGTAALTVTARNLPPTASLSGPTSGVRGQPRTFAFSATDPSPADQLAGFAFAINWGDGVSEVASAGSGPTRTHVYTAVGSYTIQIQATDKDGGTSLPATRSIDVTAVAMESDPANPTRTALILGGTPQNDTILLRNDRRRRGINVVINGTSLGSFRPTGRVITYGLGGDDSIRLTGINLPAELFGGEGNDTLVGGSGNNILVGGAGNDLLTGGGNRDLMIGGLGADQLRGGGQDDILIGGTTAFDDNEAALVAILAEWSRPGVSYSQRMNHLTSGGGLNGAVRLSAATVHDDLTADVLTGSSGQDWFWAALTGSTRDQVTDLQKKRERVN